LQALLRDHAIIPFSPQKQNQQGFPHKKAQVHLRLFYGERPLERSDGKADFVFAGISPTRDHAVIPFSPQKQNQQGFPHK